MGIHTNSMLQLRRIYIYILGATDPAVPSGLGITPVSRMVEFNYQWGS
jgi:hypothetical protein